MLSLGMAFSSIALILAVYNWRTWWRLRKENQRLRNGIHEAIKLGLDVRILDDYRVEQMLRCLSHHLEG